MVNLRYGNAPLFRTESCPSRQAVVNLAVLISSVMSLSQTTGAAQCF